MSAVPIKIWKTRHAGVDYMILLAVATMIAVSFAMVGLSKLETQYSSNEIGTAANDLFRAHVAAELADAYVQSASKLAAEVALENTINSFGRKCDSDKPITIKVSGKENRIPVWSSACPQQSLFWQLLEKAFANQFEIALQSYNRVGNTFGNPVILESKAYTYSAYPINNRIELIGAVFAPMQIPILKEEPQRDRGFIIGDLRIVTRFPLSVTPAGIGYGKEVVGTNGKRGTYYFRPGFKINVPYDTSPLMTLIESSKKLEQTCLAQSENIEHCYSSLGTIGLVPGYVIVFTELPVLKTNSPARFLFALKNTAVTTTNMDAITRKIVDIDSADATIVSTTVGKERKSHAP